MPFWRIIGGGAQLPHGPALDHVLQTGVVAVMTAAAVALLVTHPAPSPVPHAHKLPHAAAIGSAGFNLIHMHKATLAEAVEPLPQTVPVADATVRSSAPTALPATVRAPLQLPVAVPAKPLSLSKTQPASAIR